MTTSGFTAGERAALDKTIRAAEQVSRCEFSLFVGTAEGNPREFATRLHATLASPGRSILVMVDPRARVVEVVTGVDVRRTLRDREAELAVLGMQTEFAAGDLVGGLRRGIGNLALHARAPLTLHAES